MESKAQEIRSRASAAGQGQIFAFWDKLSEEERQTLVNSCRGIDFELVNKYYKRLREEEAALDQLDKSLEPLPHECCADAKNAPPTWWEKGMEEICAGRVAVLLLAGGQGTRLGSSEPKGMYNVGLPSGKTLYQIQAERIRKLEILAENATGRTCVIPWYIMTSDATQEMTRQFFELHGYFGIDRRNVFFFQQNTLPCLDFNGKIILENAGKVAAAPDGNGGLYKALGTSGALDDMRRRGIVHVHAYCVDNILVRVADPVFIGYCIEKGADCGCKVVAKEEPSEAVGVVCLYEGEYRVVEYSEISKETTEKRNEAGRLMYDAANIANHYFTIDFLERVCRQHALELPLHIAKKKIPTVDAEGKAFKPTANNGMKMEMFIFDVFRYSRQMAVMYVERNDEFSPLKNAAGASNSTPAHCRDDLMALCRRYVRAAGGAISDETPCEISPLVSYSGEGLAFAASQKFNAPLLLSPDQCSHVEGA